VKIKIAVLFSFLISVQTALAGPPGPGDGLLPGSELGRTGDTYPQQQKKFWSDDVLGQAMERATTNTGDFLSKMWTQYGPKTTTEADWQVSLRKAVEFAKSGDWNNAAINCESCIAQNPNASDAKLLKAVAYKKLNQPAKAQFSVETLMGTRQKAADFLNGQAKVAPVADTVLKQTAAK
jgi:ABC-type taurine transport system substrate-binding protein